MNSRIVITAVALTALVVATVAQAGGLRDDLDSFLDDIGGGGNATSASVYQGQSRTFLNGGRLFVRTPARNVRPVTFSRPSIKAGCSGIDAYGGGMSFISSDELVATLESTASSAASYLFLIGLRSISPQIANTLEKTFDWASKKTDVNLNTCNLGARAANSIASMSLASEEDSVCIMRRMETSNESYQEATEACSNQNVNARQDTLNDEDTGKVQFVKGNLVWMVMHKNNMFPGDMQMRELMMSITGTITKSPAAGAGAPRHKTYLSQLVASDDLLDAVLYGDAEATLHKCDGSWASNAGEFGCIDVVDSGESVHIPAGESLYGKVSAAMNNLYNKIKTQGDPAITDFDYVATTSVPANKVLTLAAGMGGVVGPQLVNKYAEVIAAEMLFSYVGRLLYAIEMEVSGEPTVSKADAYTMREMIKIVHQRLRDKAKEVNDRFDSSLRMAQELKHYENILVGAIPERVANSYRWSASF